MNKDRMSVSLLAKYANYVRDLNLGMFEWIDLDFDDYNHATYLARGETVDKPLVGMAVEYLTHLMLGAKANVAFGPSLRGASIADGIYTECLAEKEGRNDYPIYKKLAKEKGVNLLDLVGIENAKLVADELVHEVQGLDDNSIINACKLVTFDTWYRDFTKGNKGPKYFDVMADNEAIRNIRLLVNYTLKFFEKYGPVTANSFDFYCNGCGLPDYVSAAEIDFLTEDTVWDLKVSKFLPTKQNILQILLYYRLCCENGNIKVLSNIDKVGIYNPRLNVAWRLNGAKITHDLLEDLDILLHERPLPQIES